MARRRTAEEEIARLVESARRDMIADEPRKADAADKRARAKALRQQTRGQGPTATIRARLLREPEASIYDLAAEIYGSDDRRMRGRVRVIVARVKAEFRVLEVRAREMRAAQETSS